MLVRQFDFFSDFKGMRAPRWIFVVTVLAAITAPGAADASQARMGGTGSYDGNWNVTFIPQAGNCHASNTVPFTVVGQRVSSAGGGKVTGGVSSNGSVSVQITIGASSASGSGRLAGNSGAGRWSGVITGDRCSGSWQATRA
ncbi:MAG: hypothetical protein E7813_16325 [Bradyrhizobium sp.]|uniref:hypothetical protein n=1 Tax=Bradyrhizobium sp. TaxID=376 RepID=UPI00120FF916|nr:hypothetical protein [Bradyrhizobium sp.]THD64862.1 MAG: hypothetical protein E7813_16325 [Bradyrhizobium sp.]